MKRREFLGSAVLASLASQGAAQVSATPLNVLILLFDKCRTSTLTLCELFLEFVWPFIG